MKALDGLKLTCAYVDFRDVAVFFRDYARTGLRSLAAWFLVAHCGLVMAERPAREPPRLITSAHQAHNLTVAESKLGLPVHLRATVTYYDPYIDPRRGALFVCDATGCVYVAAPKRPVLPIRPGSEVDVTGVSAPGDFAPIVDKAVIRVMSAYRKLPEPRRVGPAELRNGNYDCAWVEIKGLVHEVQENGHSITLKIDDGGTLESATTVREPGVDYQRLLDSEVRIRGNAAPSYIGNRLIVGDRVFFQNITQLDIVEAGPANPFALPAIPPANVFLYRPDQAYPHRVHVRGQVTLYWPGRLLCIDDQGEGLCAQTDQRSKLTTGDVVDVVGFPSNAGFFTLSDASSRLNVHGPRPAPQTVTAEQAFKAKYDGELVKVTGRLIGQGRSGNDQALLLSASGSIFTAVLPPNTPGTYTRARGVFPQTPSTVVMSRNYLGQESPWEPNSILRVTGICLAQFEAQQTEAGTGSARPVSIRILLQSPRDVVLLQPPSWWTPRHAGVLLGLMGILILAALLWNTLLRHRVHQQTATITEQLRQEAAQAELLRALMDTVPDHIYFKDREGRLTRINRSHAQSFGLSDPSQAIGKTDFDFHDPKLARESFEEEQEIIRTGRPILAKEVVGPRPNGREAWFSVTKMPLRDGEGNIVGTFGISRDITELKRVQEALTVERNLLGALMDNMPDAIYFKDCESRFLRINASCARAFGLEGPVRAVGRTDADIFTPEHAQAALADEQKIIRTGEAMVGKVEKETWSNGHVSWVSTTKMPWRDEEGNIVGTFGISRDITELKRTEAALTVERNLLRALMDNVPDTIYFQDTECRFIRINKAQASLLGISEPEEAIGKTDFDFFPPEFAQACYEAEKRLLESGEPIVNAEQKLTRPDGRVQWLSTTEVPLRDDHGKIFGYVGISRDISDWKRAEEEIEKARAAAEAGSRAKSEFLANMSHEIRTPMNGILGMTELALDTPLSSDQREYLTMVKDSADSLLTLLNDILDFSKIEAGKLNLEPVEFQLHDLLSNTLRPLSVRASQKGLEIASSSEAGVPERVLADPGRIRQILVNLVGNAIKFTEQGEIVIRVNVKSRRDRDTLLHFSVRDTGIGISPEKQKAIFEAFTQADSSMTRRFGGTGLGLTISSRLVEMMNGEIWVESQPGKGSTFHFTAWVAEPAGDGQNIPPREVISLQDMRALIVDDNSTNRKILHAMLKHWLMDPELAESAAEGLVSMEKALAAGKPFPLVILDAQMPGMDGFALAEKIRQNPRLAGATIMMLTSAGRRGDAGRCRELGIKVYLIKPIRQSELLEAILAALGKPPTAGTHVTPITRHTLRENRRKLRILLAEDNIVNQQLAVRLLEKRGHTVAVASNGSEALNLLRASRFDLILMDVQMPVMDGFQATAAIREEEQATGRHVPIIAMTAHAMQGDRERCLEGGMDAYISKPVRADELTTMVEEIAQLGSAPAQSPEPNSSQSAFDAAEALNRLGGDKELLAELVRIFLKDCPRQLTELRQSVSSGDSTEIERAAHSLKGSVGNFGRGRAFEIALKLEKCAHDGDHDQCRPLFATLETELETLQAELEQMVTSKFESETGNSRPPTMFT